ncbi:MAG: slipin family protein [Rhodospirillales bacterium]|nr:slipin family protein [Rhodospirillales bacterium]MCB9965611.1 slipin family protein [Rhodospirillales bacterium]MCB9973942.1 slipin family protein [Rhodospirillales bacterium]
MPFIVPVLILLGIFLFACVKIIKEYERGVIYTLGKFTGIVKPGLRLIVPGLQQMTKVDMRVRTEDVPAQDVISRDNVSVRVSAVVYYRVVDPGNAINAVEDFLYATAQLAQTTLRSVLGKHELDDMLSNRDQLNHDLQELLDHQAEGWGIKVTNVEIKQVDIDPSMIRAIAKQAEAERERRAKIINAEGEFQAAKQLDEAAAILANRPETMQLRYLGTLNDFVNAKGSTIVLPFPMDLLKGISEKVTSSKK